MFGEVILLFLYIAMAIFKNIAHLENNISSPKYLLNSIETDKSAMKFFSLSQILQSQELCTTLYLCSGGGL